MNWFDGAPERLGLITIRKVPSSESKDGPIT
jgi:hypothetical protein